MNTQNISKTFVLGIFAFLVLSLTASFALADDLSISAPSIITQSLNSTFTITVTGNSAWNIVLPASPITIDDGNGHNARLTLKTSGGLNGINSSGLVTVNVSATSVDSGFYLGQQTKTITINAANSSNTSQQISATNVDLNFAQTYCENGKVGSDLEITGLTDNDLDNANDWEWAPKNNIDLTLRVRNNNQDDISGHVYYGIYDSSNGDFIWDTDQTETLTSKETTDITLSFQVPTKGLTSDSYRFYVKVYDDGAGEDLQCTDQVSGSFYKSITIKRDSHKVLLDNIVVPAQVSCGTDTTLSMEAFNIGRNDEKKVKVVVANTALNLDQEFIINNLNKGDSKKFDFSFTTPITASEGTYPLTITSYYYYDSSGDSYRDSDVSTSNNLVLKGNCVITAGDIAIDVNPQDAIQSGGVAGQKLVVKATVSNTASRAATLSVKASGYDSWATLDTISPQTLSIPAGSSQDVLFTFDVNKDVKGDQTFNFEVDSDNQKLKDQTVSVPITAARAFGITGNVINSDNWYLWAIGAFNIILVIIIIIVAIRVARR